MRPPSIEKFDLIYLISLAISVGAFMLGYEEMVIKLRAETAAAGFEIGGNVLIGGFIAMLAVSLVLWYLISKKANLVAKWVMVAFVGLGLINVPGVFADAFTLADGLNLASYGLAAVAAWFLFQDDTKPWFDVEHPQHGDYFK